MKYLGDFLPCQTVRCKWNTFDSSGASVTMSGLLVTGIEVYRDSSMTQRSSDNGYTLLDTDGIDIDGITGAQGFEIDLSDNSDAGFFAVGHDYSILVTGLTVDGQSISFFVAEFSICNRNQPGILLRTTVASVTDQTHIALTAGPASDDWLNNKKIVVRDITSGEVADGVISDYTASGFAVVLLNALAFTIAAGDNVEVYMSSADLMATPADFTTALKTDMQADPTQYEVNVKEWNNSASAVLSIRAILNGKRTVVNNGDGTYTETYYQDNGTTVQITGTIDANGNRTIDSET